MHLFVSTARSKYPLFGLTELGNMVCTWPKIPALHVDAPLGDCLIMYAQCYSSTVKGLENRVPLLHVARPNLLTYHLREAYMSQNSRFRPVWEEVHTQRMLNEILEIVHLTVALDASMEVVVTDINTSFLVSFTHHRLSRVIIGEGLLV